jgi:hypothetical protein
MTTRRVKLIWIAPAVLGSFALLFLLVRPVREMLYNAAFSYVPLHDARARLLNDRSLVAVEIDALPIRPGSDVCDLAELAARFVAQRLSYSSDGGYDYLDPEDVYQHRLVHCGGYSSLFAATLTRLLQRAGLPEDYSVRIQTGRVRFLNLWNVTFSKLPIHLHGLRREIGINFEYHTYNTICPNRGGRSTRRRTADANLYDYTGVLFVRESAVRTME